MQPLTFDGRLRVEINKPMRGSENNFLRVMKERGAKKFRYNLM